MKEKDLLKALSDIDDRLIEEADPQMTVPGKRSVFRSRGFRTVSGLAAACLVFVVGLGTWRLQNSMENKSAEESSIAGENIADRENQFADVEHDAADVEKAAEKVPAADAEMAAGEAPAADAEMAAGEAPAADAEMAAGEAPAADAEMAAEEIPVAQLEMAAEEAPAVDAEMEEMQGYWEAEQAVPMAPENNLIGPHTEITGLEDTAGSAGSGMDEHVFYERKPSNQMGSEPMTEMKMEAETEGLTEAELETEAFTEAETETEIDSKQRRRRN